jgi:glycosyltransferase involved in cell wall biosynthesis
MTNFAIIIPFRPKAESSDWESESILLIKTIRSVLNQTYSLLKIFVVYTEEPQYLVDDPRVVYLPFPYGYQPYEQIQNRDDLMLRFKSKKMVSRRWDKARKLCYASKIAKENGAHYIMAMDADDRISNKLLEYLAANSNNNYCDGWYAEKGYLYKDGANYLIRLPKNMRYLNGSTHILRADLVTIPDFNSLDWLDYNLFTDHGWIKVRMKEYFGAILEPVPFPFVVYYVHQSNISEIRNKEYAVNYKTILKRLLRSISLTKELRDEFGLDAA